MTAPRSLNAGKTVQPLTYLKKYLGPRFIAFSLYFIFNRYDFLKPKEYSAMPPKVSQLLTRVLAREHDDDGSSSSDSEEDYGLKQMAANASAGLRMGKGKTSKICRVKYLVHHRVCRPLITVLI